MTLHSDLHMHATHKILHILMIEKVFFSKSKHFIV